MLFICGLAAVKMALMEACCSAFNPSLLKRCSGPPGPWPHPGDPPRGAGAGPAAAASSAAAAVDRGEVTATNAPPATRTPANTLRIGFMFLRSNKLSRSPKHLHPSPTTREPLSEATKDHAKMCQFHPFQ